MTRLAEASIALVGAGRMGGAMLRGWLDLGIAAERLSVFDPQPGQDIAALCGTRGLALNPPPERVGAVDIVILAVKPQTLDAVAPGVAPMVGAETLLLSVIAGKTIADLAARLPAAGAIVRAMPNTPAAVGRGITGVALGGPLSAERRESVDRLLQAVGRVEWLDDERLLDAVTAVSGSGPAYVFYLVECLAKAGERAGLEPGLAMRLARATVEGAGELMYREAGVEPAMLRRNVTSPGGTTAAGLEILTGPAGLDELMGRAVAAAKRRSEELAG
ncbi:MAG TPA: pyrroline-5-carboxylate reductase [Lichenihabitans sp.]|nr:pyrroline-5-carboxylate reductase [Lichenihabitans sp.]